MHNVHADGAIDIRWVNAAEPTKILYNSTHVFPDSFRKFTALDDLMNRIRINKVPILIVGGGLTAISAIAAILLAKKR